MSLLGPDPEQVASAQREFVNRVYARQIQPDAHMTAEGICGPIPEPSTLAVPEPMGVGLLTVLAEAVLKALYERGDTDG